MSNTPPNQPDADSEHQHANENVTPVLGPPANAIPQEPPPSHQAAQPGKHGRWTNDPGMFFLTAVGLIALVFYTYYTRQLVVDGETASAQQAVDLKRSFEKTDEAIAASNRLAEEAARAAAESHRLADAAAQSAEETRRLADEAEKTAIAAATANDLTRQLSRSATEANQINKQALVGVQRAFMFVHGPTTVPITASYQMGQKPALMGWNAIIQWENSGNTPTQNLVITTHCLQTARSIADPFAVLITDPHSKFLTTTDYPTVFGPKQIEPGSNCFVGLMSTFINQLLALKFQPRGYHSYAFGTARYQDRFSSGKTYRTDFCFEPSVTGGELEGEVTGDKNPPAAQINTSQCRIHNCADEECEQQDRQTERVAKDSPPDLGWKLGESSPN